MVFFFLSVNWNKIKEINQEPKANPSAFQWHFKKCPYICTTLDLASLQGNGILRLHFITQRASDIRGELQKLNIEPDTPTSHQVKVPY